MFNSLKQRARQFKTEAFVLYLAVRDPRTPWYTKLFVAGIAAYVFSPIDLIQDFMPVVGFLDDLILVPLGIALAIKLVPSSVLDDCHKQVKKPFTQNKRVGLPAQPLRSSCCSWLRSVVYGATTH